MRYEDILAIKLQMGINPSVRIAPNMLLAMWQQLNLECKSKLPDRQALNSTPKRMASTPVDV